MRSATAIENLYTICSDAARLLGDYAYYCGNGNPYADTLRDDVHLMGGRLRVTHGGEIAAALLLHASEYPDHAEEHAESLRAICRALHWVTGDDH